MTEKKTKKLEKNAHAPEFVQSSLSENSSARVQRH